MAYYAPSLHSYSHASFNSVPAPSSSPSFTPSRSSLRSSCSPNLRIVNRAPDAASRVPLPSKRQASFKPPLTPPSLMPSLPSPPSSVEICNPADPVAQNERYALGKQSVAPVPDNNSTPHFIFQRMKGYLSPLLRPDSQLANTPFLEIENVSLPTFKEFLRAYGEDRILAPARLEYDAISNRITVCAPPKPYHDCTPNFLVKSLRLLNLDTPEREDTLQVTQISWSKPDGSILTPDAAIAVISIVPPIRLWPTIVVEVANTQTYESVFGKIKRWFRASEGEIEVALLLKFTAKDPLSDPSSFIEVYRSRARARSPSDESTSTPSSSTSQADDSGQSFGDEQTSGQDDTTTDSQSTTSSDSDSHLNRGSEASATSDSDKTSDDADSDDSNSPAAAYAEQHLLEVYQDGPRYTVLPECPEQTQIALRYSDFFGSQNIPQGRDGNEVHYLQLGLLRDQIEMLMALTRAKALASAGVVPKRKKVGGQKRMKKR